MKDLEKVIDKIMDHVDDNGVDDAVLSMAITSIATKEFLLDIEDKSPKEKRKLISDMIILSLGIYFNNGGNKKRLTRELLEAIDVLDVDSSDSDIGELESALAKSTSSISKLVSSLLKK